MPAKDRLHDVVVRALQKEGWTVREQYSLRLQTRRLWIDLYATKAEEALAIAIEVKDLEDRSPVDALASALGKYLIYRTTLDYLNIATPLYLAVPNTALAGILYEPIGELLQEKHAINLLLFDPRREVISEWIHRQ
jgi:hypothetical protein